jgi:threonine/homoserine/homoserine lactone efflux protein
MELFLYGIAVGLAISIPMGSVGVSIIHRIIINNQKRALFVAFGSTTADTIFGIIAVYGLSTLASFITDHKFVLGTIGGLCLLYLSFKIFFSSPHEFKENDSLYSISKDFATGFILTITNPLTAVAILGLFAWFGINDGEITFASATILIVGLLTGLILWWLTLIKIAKHINSRLNISSFKIVNQIFGLILFILAILILTRVF